MSWKEQLYSNNDGIVEATKKGVCTASYLYRKIKEKAYEIAVAGYSFCFRFPHVTHPHGLLQTLQNIYVQLVCTADLHSCMTLPYTNHPALSSHPSPKTTQAHIYIICLHICILLQSLGWNNLTTLSHLLTPISPSHDCNISPWTLNPPALSRPNINMRTWDRKRQFSYISCHRTNATHTKQELNSTANQELT